MDEVIKILKKDHDVVIVSSNISENETRFLAKYELLNYFDEIYAKPSNITEVGIHR